MQRRFTTAGTVPPASSSAPLQCAHATGRAAWPELEISAEEFASQATQTSSGEALCEHADELYLCAACTLNRPRAHELFEKKYFPSLQTALRRLLGRPDEVEEILQEVRSRLLVGPVPKIATYRGNGPLKGWLRSVAVRAALDYLDAKRRRVLKMSRFAEFQAQNVANDTLSRAPGAALDFGSSLPVIWQAWSDAVRALECEQRKLLHDYVVHAQSIDVLAAAHVAHRATIARRIQRARQEVRGRVLEQLLVHFQGVSVRELEAMALAACQELDLATSLAG